MTAPPPDQRVRKRREPRPLDADSLRELALGYAARFATTEARLVRYLKDKLRARGWAGEAEPDLAALAGQLVRLGYVDDAAFARGREAGLLRRGYGPRRVSQALAAAGVSQEVREELPAGEAEARRAALAFAARRAFGPFGPEPPDRLRREKQVAAMLRAGHSLDSAREMVDAATREAAEQWAAEVATDDEGS